MWGEAVKLDLAGKYYCKDAENTFDKNTTRMDSMPAI